MRKVLFVVNPASAGGRTLERWNDAIFKLEDANLDYDVKFTKGRGCGVLFTKEAVATGNYQTIVSVGGDGTANEVVNGLMSVNLSYETLPAFTIFSSGTGSDSVRTLGIAKDIEGFVRVVEANDPKLIDVGMVQYVVDDELKIRYFLNASDIGIGAAVAHSVNSMNQDHEKKSGKGKYFRSIIQQIFKFKAFNVTCYAKDTHYLIKKTVIVAVCNGMFFGGGVKISPVSKMDDGVLELAATNNVSKFGLLGLVSKVYTGSHVDHPLVKFQRGQHFKIKLETPQLLETDGEVCGFVSEVYFSVIPQAIKVLC